MGQCGGKKPGQYLLNFPRLRPLVQTITERSGSGGQDEGRTREGKMAFV